MNSGSSPEVFDFRLKPIPETVVLKEIISFVCAYDGCAEQWRDELICVMAENRGEA